MLSNFYHFIILEVTISTTVDKIIQSHEINVPGHFHWTHHSVASTVLYCPNCCHASCFDFYIRSAEFTTDSKTMCCIEKARPLWNFLNNITVPLELKFNNSRHTLLESFYMSNDTVQVFRYTDGNMTIFPVNICNFSRIVKIELKKNKFENLTNLSCLKFLDYLNLDYNKIRSIGASSFFGMSFLRELHLSHNLISFLEPETFTYRPGSLAYVILKNNYLQTIDLSNMFLNYFFSSFSFYGNNIAKITNALNWTGFLNVDTMGGGRISLRNNHFTRMPSLSELGIKDVKVFLKMSFNYQFELHENQWSCDCEYYPYLLFAIPASIHFKGISLECASPPLLHGYTTKMFREHPALLKYLVCEVSLEHKCPPKCLCYKQPSEKRVVVNCSSTDRRKMPKIVPDFDDLDLDLSHNNIEILENLNFLNRAKMIDLSYNVITLVDSAVFGIEKLSFINLVHNQITHLERSIQLKNPCKLWFGNVTLLKCNCNMRWIKNWLERQTTQKCKMENIITCQQYDKRIDLILSSEDDLCPSQQAYSVYCWFAAATFIMVLFTIIFYNFRYEIKLLFRIIKVYLRHKNSSNWYEYDVYVSFNMDNNDVTNWTIRTLRPFIENQCYTICLPPRDFNAGTIYMEEIYTKIATSKSFIVVLSQDYEQSEYQNIEWKHIWNTFMTNSMATITIINYDFLQSKDIKDRKLKSFLRLGCSFNFDNFNNTLLHDIQVKIGPPIRHEPAVFVLS